MLTTVTFLLLKLGSPTMASSVSLTRCIAVCTIITELDNGSIQTRQES